MPRITTTATLAACLCTVAATRAADPPPPELKAKVDRYVADRERQKNDELEDLKSTLTRINGNPRFKKMAADAKKRMKALTTETEHAVPRMIGKLEKDRIGLLDDGNIFVTVLEVVDGSNMIVELKSLRPSQAASNRSDAPTWTNVVWLKGVDSSGSAEGSKVKPGGFFQVTGNKTYDTVDGGQKTVFVIEPFDYKAIEPYLDPPKTKGKRRSAATAKKK